MDLREAAQQALEALELAGMSHDVMLMSDPPQDAWKARAVNWKLAEAINALRAALADTQDWNEIEALRASLREHMAEIHRLRAAGRQALGALQFGLPLIEDYGDEEQLAIHHKALAGLTEYAMQRLTDVQQEIENGANTVQSPGGIYSRVFDSGDRNVEAVTNCHEKEGGKLSPPLNDPETNFGSMGQAVDSTRADHIADANKMVASINEMETVEPVAYVTGYRDGWCVISPVEPVVLPTGMALYRSPPTCQESRQVEPVAWMVYALDGQSAFVTDNPADFTLQHRALPLYTAPPKREPLTNDEIR